MKKLLIGLSILFGIFIVVFIILVSFKNVKINSLISENDKIKTEYILYKENVEKEVNNLREINSILKKDIEPLIKGQELLDLKYEELLKENEILIEKLKNNSIIDDSIEIELKYIGIEDYQILVKDLLKKPKLIPYEGVLGGTMGFSNVCILNNIWAYGRFDDGHYGGYGLFQFNVDDDLNISWKVLKTVLDN